jgi:hypothetical protein
MVSDYGFDQRKNGPNAHIFRKGNVIERILETAQNDAGLTGQKIIYGLLISPFEADQYLSTLIRNELLIYDNQVRA